MTKQELIERVYEAETARRGAQRRTAGGELTKKAVAAIVDSVFCEIADYFVTTQLAKPASKAGAKARNGSVARFTYPGFGTFTKRRRPARPGRNPKTGEAVPIPPTLTVHFAPGTELKGAMNEPAAGGGARKRVKQA
jgi:DNA-binding protein HU-beta